MLAHLKSPIRILLRVGTISKAPSEQKSKKFNSLAIDGQPPISVNDYSLKLCDIFQSPLKRAGVSPAGIVIIL